MCSACDDGWAGDWPRTETAEKVVQIDWDAMEVDHDGDGTD